MLTTNFKIIPDKTPTIAPPKLPNIFSLSLLLINSPINAPMQAPNIMPIGPRIKKPKNRPTPVPTIPFLELPNFLAVINGKKKSPKKNRIEISRVNIRNLKLIILLELK